MAFESAVLSVSQLNEYLKMLLDGNELLSNVYVRGEISNFKCYQSSGHLYFTLKDDDGQLRAVMFRMHASRLKFMPSDGMKVIARGRVSVYPQSGQYQLYVEELVPDGAGSLAMRYEQLRRKLESEGLFDLSRKKQLPEMPMRVGVITSPSGAAVHDIKNVLGRRFPMAEMILFPSAVQGAEAPPQLRAGIEFFSMTQLCDVIIIGRGGGSAEDLWAFNDELLARAIAACPIPVISAVGHESDFTICDFVADRRAPTPSAAAELAVPDKNELLGKLSMKGERLHTLVSGKLAQERRYLERLATSPIWQKPERIFDRPRMRLSDAEDRLTRSIARKTETGRHRLAEISGRLDALSPLGVLARGYTTVSRDGVTLTRACEVKPQDRLEIRFADGRIAVEAIGEKGEN